MNSWRALCWFFAFIKISLKGMAHALMGRNIREATGKCAGWQKMEGQSMLNNKYIFEDEGRYFFKGESIGAHWGNVLIDKPKTPRFEPEVERAMERSRKRFQPGAGQIFNIIL